MKRKIGVIFAAIMVVLALVIGGLKTSEKISTLKVDKTVKASATGTDLDNSFTNVTNDTAVNGVPNLQINSYFDDDGTYKKNGTALDIATENYAKLYVFINYVDSNAVIKNTRVTVQGSNSRAASAIQTNEYITNVHRADLGTEWVDLADFNTGNEFTMFFDYVNAVEDGNHGMHAERYSNDLVVTVEGDIEINGTTTHFTKEMNRYLEWYMDFDIDYVIMRNKTNGVDSENKSYDMVKLPDNRMCLLLEVSSGSTGSIFESAEYKLEEFNITIGADTYTPVSITTLGQSSAANYNSSVTGNESTYNNNVFTYSCTQVDAGNEHYQLDPVSYIQIIYPSTMYTAIRNLNQSMTHTYKIKAEHRGFGNENITYSNTSLIGRTDTPDSSLGSAYRYTGTKTAAITVTITNYTDEVIRYESKLDALCKANSLIAYKRNDASNTKASYIEELIATVMVSDCVDSMKFVTNDSSNADCFYNQSDVDMSPNIENIRSYEGILISKETFARIGDSGWIKLYSAGSSSPFATINKSGDKWMITVNGTTSELDQYNGNYKYMFESTYKNIEIETSEIITAGEAKVLLLVDIDNAKLMNAFTTESSFDAVKGIKAPSYLAYTIGSDNGTYPYEARKDFGAIELRIGATGEVVANLYKKTEYQHSVGISPEKYLGYEELLTIVDPIFIVKYPESISKVEIEDKTKFISTNPDITVTNALYNPMNNYVYITTSGATTEGVNIKFNAITTPNMDYVLSHPDENDDGYKIINYGASRWKENGEMINVTSHVIGNEVAEDAYDLDRDSDKTENVTIVRTKVNYSRMFGVGVAPYIVYGGDEYVQGDVAKVKGSDAGRTVTIKNRIDNFSENALTEVNIVGVIPYEGNQYLSTDSGADLGSTFSTTMTSDGITVPTALASSVKVYYSEEDVSLNGISTINGLKNGYTWKEAGAVSNWNNIKSYRIDFNPTNNSSGGRAIASNETFEFTYNVKLPSSSDSNFTEGAESYTTVGVAYVTDNKFYSTSAGSVGMSFKGDNIDGFFQKVDKQTNTVLNNAKYIVRRSDGKKIENYVSYTSDETELVNQVELNFNNSSRSYQERMKLYVGVDYIMDEQTAPTGYKKSSFMFRIDMDAETKDYVATVKKKNETTGNYDVSVTASEVLSLREVSGKLNIKIKEEKDSYNYTVNYYKKGTTTKVKESKTASAEFGSTITAASEKVDIAGYTYDSCNPNSITISATPTNNVINLYYTNVDCEYTVNYYLKGTTTKIKESVSKPADYNSTVTAVSEVITIDGYTYDSCNPNSITISSTAANNVINLYYTRNNYNYTVNYYEKGTTTSIHTPKTASAGYGNTITAASEVITISGYTYDSCNPNSITISTTPANNVINLYYTKATSTYTVNYYLKGTSNKIAPSKENVTANVGDVITAESEKNSKGDIAGYVYDSCNPNQITIQQTASQNVINLYYRLNTAHYSVEYYYQNANGSYNTVPDSTLSNQGPVTVGSRVLRANINTTPDSSKGNYVLDEETVETPEKTYDYIDITETDSNNVFKVYFRRQTYTITYKEGDHGDFDDDVHSGCLYGTKTPACRINPNDAENHEVGYTFTGWKENGTGSLISNTAVQNINVTKNTTYVAQWTPAQVGYTVEYYYQQNGQYPSTTNLKDTSRTALTESKVSVTNDDKTPQMSGYIYDSTTSTTVGLLNNIPVAGDGSTVLKVYFKPQYTVNYVKGEHGRFATQTTSGIDYGSSTPAFVGDLDNHDPGWKFTGWSPTVANTVTQDATYVAQWEAIDVPYRVNYYYQRNGSYSTTADDSRLGLGTTETIAIATAQDMTPQRTGYIYDNGAANVLSQAIAGDGSTVLKIYFKPQFKVTYEPGDQGTFAPQSTTGIDYGTTTPAFVGEKTCNPGYRFVKWNPTVASTVTQDATYVAQWEAIEVPYTVEYYYEVNGVYRDTPDSVDDTRKEYTGRPVSVTPADKNPTRNGYVYDQTKSELVGKLSDIVAGDGSTVLKVYFKEQFTVIYLKGDHGGFPQQTDTNIDYGTVTPAFRGNLGNHDPGYEFTGWDPVVAATVTANATYVAQWRAIDVPYKVEFYYQENGSYPTTPYATVTRMATTDTPVSLTTPSAVNDMTVLVTDNKETNADISRPRYDSNYVYDSNARNVTSDNTVNGDGSTVLKVYFKEIPVNYDVDVVLKNTADTTLTRNQFTITRSGTNSSDQVLWDSRAVSDSTEIEERKAIIDTYSYKIYENETANSKYVNVLNNKYVGVDVHITNSGGVELQDWAIYNADGTRIGTTDPVYSYVVPSVSTGTNGYKKISVKVINPVTFTFQLKKVDTEGEALADTGMSITSEIIDDQNAAHKNEIETESMNGLQITTSGVVTGETDDAGIIKYEETWVNQDTYTYEITELQAAGNQYSNILDGYKVVVTVQVAADGTLTLVRTNNRNYTIVATQAGKTVTDDLYNYVKVTASSNSLNAIIDGTGSVNVEVENPVKFNLDIDKVNTEGNGINGVKFSVNRGNTQLFNGNVTANVEVEENPIDAGTYTYKIRETQAASTRYDNILENRYIQLVVKVHGDGIVEVLSQNGDDFKIFNESGSEVTDYDNVLKFVAVTTGVNNNVYTIKVKVTNPLRYNVDIETKDTSGNFLDQTDVTIRRENVARYDGDATQSVEVEEKAIAAGTYNYYFTQNASKTDKYVNPLDGKFIKAEVNVSTNGALTVNKVEVYEGTIGALTARQINSASLQNYFRVTADNSGSQALLKVTIIDPVRFTVELKKLNTEENGIENTNVTIKSGIVDSQNAVYSEENQENAESKDGLDIAENGEIYATTDDSGIVKYQETFVNANIYTYEITEDEAAGNQYVNVLEGLKVIVRVRVGADGTLTLVDASGNAYRQSARIKYTIVDSNGQAVATSNAAYRYVFVSTENNSLNAIINHTDKLNVEITNPVRFNMDLIKKDSAGNNLAGTTFSVARNGEQIFNGAPTTAVEVEENPIDAGTYLYIITETNTATTRYSNILNNKYIRLVVKVDGDGTVNFVPQNGKSYRVYNNDGSEVTDQENVLRFIDITKEVATSGEDEGVTTINVKVENPVKYNLDIETLDTDNRFLDSTNVTVQREDTRVYTGYPTTAIEREESPIVAGTYNYYITQDTTKTEKYINPLEGKFAKVNVTVAPDGILTVNSTEIYEGAVGSPSARLIATGEIAKYFSVTADNSGSISTLKVSIKDPVRFTVELKKIDTDGEALADTDVTIKSGVVDAQDAVHSDEIESESKDGLEIAATGEVSGTTDDSGIVKYEETWVDANVYTYEITEDKAAGNQYVNILDGYKVVVKVRVAADGTLSFERQNGKNYLIVATEAGKVVTDDMYRYVGVTIENDSLTAIIDHTGKLSVEITNPVRFNIDLIKKDTAGNDLAGTKFSVVRDRTSLLNNALVTPDIEIREDPIDAGTYTYIITENSSATTRYDNILENKYIQLKIKVNANGHIDILDQGENNFKVFNNTGTEITDVKNVLKYIEVWSEVGETGDEEGVTTVKVKVVNPVKYNVDITTATTAYAEDKDINDYFLDETDVVAYWVRVSDNEKQDVWRGEPIKAVEKLVKPVEAGEYLYFFTQTSTRNNKLVNPLENKYVVAKVTVSPDGMLTVGNVRLFRGTIGDPHTDEVVDDEAEKYYSITADNTGDISTLKILIIDPVRFTVEVNKLDTEEEQNGIENTQITINSSVIDEQNAVHEDEVKETSKSKDGLDIRENGQIEAETDKDGQIKFEETWVDSNESNSLSDANQNYYTYEITEDRTAGAQYVNVLEGYKVIVRVYVSPDGDLKLVNENGNEYSRYTAVKYTIVDATTGAEIPQDDVAYKYVNVSIVENTVKAIIRETDMLKVDITNPVRFDIDLIKKDTADNFLYGTLFSVEREGNDVPLFDESEVTEEIEIREEPMDAGIYTYYIRENETNKTVGNRYVNVLENKYIKLRLRVNGDGVIEILDNAGTHNSDYFEVYEEGTGRRITDDDVLRYISVLSHDEDGDGIYTVDVQVINPVRYEIDIIKLDTLGNFLDQTNVTLYRQENDGNRELYRGDATDVNVIHEVERLEVPMDAGTYIYYVTENRTKNERYVNIIEGRYIKMTLTVAPNGMLTVEQELYEGDVGEGTKVETGSVFDYYSVEVDNTIDLSNPDNVSRLNITLINPVRFIVELDKFDTVPDPLIGATFEIESPIIDEQDYEHDNRTISGIREGGITEDGTVTGTSEYDVDKSPDGSILRARISYEETWVDANQTEDDYYTYIIKETKTPGAQYVNMLDGYQVVVKVHVDPEGNLELKEVDGRNYEIVMTGEKDVDPVTDELYRYVSIRVSNNKILATLNTEVINPVRYKIAVHQTIYGDEQIPLRDIPVQVQSEFSGITTLVTDENGYSEMEEWAVWADTYEYRFFQLNDFMGRAVEDEFVNMFDGYYIGIDLYVPGDGDIKTISEDGDYTTVSYKIFKKEDDGSYSQVNFRNTILNDFVRVKIIKDEDNVCTLNIYFITPEKYDFRLVKTDIDTEFNMNNVQFSVTPSDENGEIELKEVDNSVKYKFNSINTKEQLTGIVDGVDGVISFKDILIERAGTYTFELEETTPIVEGMIYKDKSENVIVQADIAIENGKYVLTNMHVVQADRYTIPENTELMGAETQTVNVNVTNERIKGSYDLVLNKFNKFTGLPLDGAVYKVTVEQEGKDNKVLYLSDGNVLSKNVLIPHVEEESLSEDGVTALNDIRIEIPETYTIKIEEIKAPDTFTKLDDVIELEVTTGIEGEYDDAHYVLKEIKLKDGNHDLVSETHSMPEDNDQNINVNIMNEYFDLALRQYVTDVNGTAITNRAPVIDLDKLQSAEATTADYTQLKDPQRAYAGQEVIYTIEVYNEGIIDGYAEEIVEHLPRGLEFVDDEFNSEYGWRYDKQNHEVVTNILAKEESEDNVIRAYDKDTMTLSSKKIQLKLRVADDVKLKTILTTIAEVRMSLAKDRKETLDRDSYDLASIPFGESLARYAEWQEDDDDFEKLVIEEFDLATVKYVKSVNGEEQENRKPRIALDKERAGEYKEGIYNGFNYKPDNELLKVKQNDVLVYGIEIFNEGSVGSYATEVRDTIPNGLIFNKDSEINKKYGWKMLDENENETDDVTKAKYVVTDYLSKAKETEENGNVIKALDVSDGKITIDSRVLEVEFTVTEPGKQSRIAENVAEVTKFIDDQGINVKDRDPEERLQENKERIYIKIFDLELEQRINYVEVTNKLTGAVTVVEPDEAGKLAKIDIAKSKLMKTDILVEYSIKVTNNGETAGYATRVADYIPEGFEFNAEDNENWAVEGDHLVTDALANTIINPGETKEVKLVLRWNGSSNNIGQMTNTSEIAEDKDENKKDVIDIDSTPNNLALAEDDIDITDILITVKTGSTEIIIMIAALGLMIATSLGIAKYNNKRKNN